MPHLGYKFDRLSDAVTEKEILMYHRIIESFKFAYARRSELGDEQFVNISDVSHKHKTHAHLHLSSLSVVFGDSSKVTLFQLSSIFSVQFTFF